ncbi:Alg9-like mannosyltransferase family-domain-containing protein [Catenaria anguillulae PL171]|uniref:Mannosyltransferase n=1 Tax=Catenaria anguillulae PL171 TaxID=765915 RepID=A0A1Y2HBX8_9FUNG|nr:Alg9-like mannosyltransferase family-domain-containing protein [Catenaria anguillulae PL171]
MDCKLRMPLKSQSSSRVTLAPPPPKAMISKTSRGRASLANATTPGGSGKWTWWTVTTLLVAARVLGAWYSPITDCDETFNYWEPLHFAISGGSHGLQTWEYAPQFALRSWAYIAPYAAAATGFLGLGLSWRNTFFAIRIALALVCACFELKLTSAMNRFDTIVDPPRGSQTSAAVFLLLILAFSPGMFHSAPAFLPSSFAMICTLSAMSSWSTALRTSRGSARPRPSLGVILSIGTGSLLGWPFAAALGLPYALPYLVPLRTRLAYPFLRTTVLVATAILAPMLAIDSYMYARPWLLVPINLVMYNVIRNQSALYGVESGAFYLKNLALNWTPPVLILALATTAVYLVPGPQRGKDAGWTRGVAWMLAVWLGVFTMQAHKEERFMAPAYPCVAVMAARGAAWTAREVDARVSGWHRTLVVGLCAAAVVGFAVLRMGALVVYYAAPVRLDLSAAIPQSTSATTVNVCTGNDWFLAPGHFHLPRHARIRFVRQAFDGHLPADFAPSSGSATAETSMVEPWVDRLARVRNATSAVGQAEFNDKNQVTESRFVPLSQCDYILGRDPIVSRPSFTVACAPMLHADHTPMWSRVLYHPFKSLGKQVWQDYCLWKV